MARFGPRADGPLSFGPGQAGPIYKRRTGPKWADGPSRAPEKPARAGPKRAGPWPDTSLVGMFFPIPKIYKLGGPPIIRCGL